jgi:polysaccharide biosynthesis protein VpsM
MHSINRNQLVGGALCLLMLLPLCLYGQEAKAAGRMLVKPKITTGASYDSNYYLNGDDRSVATYFIRPGIEFGYTTGKSNLIFNYELDANWYDEDGNLLIGEISGDENDYVGHDMEFSADTQLTERLKIGVGDTFILTRNPEELDYYSNEVIRNKYSKNIINPEIYYQLGVKIGLSASYTNTDINYDEDINEDSKENKLAFNLHYNLNSLNSLELQYQFWDKEYDSLTPDYDSNQIMLTFSRALKYYTLLARGGYHKRSFDRNLQDDQESFVWGLSIFGDRPQMLFSLSQNYNATAINSEYYLATRFLAEAGHLFLEKLNVKFRGYYQYSYYQDHPLNRSDDTWAVSCTVTYLRNEYLSFYLKPGFQTRDSSMAGDDYDNTYIMAGITVNYDLGAR